MNTTCTFLYGQVVVALGHDPTHFLICAADAPNTWVEEVIEPQSLAWAEAVAGVEG